LSQPTNNGRRRLAADVSAAGNFAPAITILNRKTAATIDWNAQSSRNTQMNVVIRKLNGLWHLIVGSCQIRTPFLETQDRARVVTYARRVYPGAKIFQRD
jgi:hypothetical protein